LQFNIPINNEQLIQLFDYCDVNNDGWIDYVEFSNFLNWKNPMHSGFPKRQLISVLGCYISSILFDLFLNKNYLVFLATVCDVYTLKLKD